MNNLEEALNQFNNQNQIRIGEVKEIIGSTEMFDISEEDEKELYIFAEDNRYEEHLEDMIVSIITRLKKEGTI